MKQLVFNVAANCSLFLIFCGLGGLILEGSIRVLFPIFDPSGRVEYKCTDGVHRGPENINLRQYTNTGEYDYRVAFNQYGFRDSKDLAQSSNEDIFVVGDSFSIGQGVEKQYRYSDILDKTLPTNVLNISSPNNLNGYYWLLKYAESKGASIKNIIVGICMENDLEQYSVEIGKCTETPPVSWKSLLPGRNNLNLQQIKKTLLKYSATYSLITSIAHQHNSLRNLAIRLGIIYKNDVFPYSLSQFNGNVLQSSANRVADLVHNYNALILVIPSRGLWQGNNREESRKIHDHFISLLNEQQLDVIDLKHAFEQSGNPLSFHYRKEGHWNAKGHHRAAEEIQSFLKHSTLFGAIPQESLNLP